MQAYLWQEIELTLTAENSYANPYTDLQLWIDFTHESGQQLRRPAFWDGGQTWRIRLAPTKAGRWTWRSFSNVADEELIGKTGELTAVAPEIAPDNRFHRHGFWRMSPGGRNYARSGDGLLHQRLHRRDVPRQDRRIWAGTRDPGRTATLLHPTAA